MKEGRFPFTYRDRDVAVFVYQTDDHAAAKAPPLVMIHGFRGTHHGLLDIVDQIAKLDQKKGIERSIFVPDLPNFGASAPFSDQTHSADTYAEMTEHLIREISRRLGATAVDVFGHSFGTLVAARVAKNAPESVRKLILAAPIARPQLSHLNAKLTDISYMKVGQLLPAKLANRWLRAKFAIRAMNAAAVKNPALKREILAKHLAHFADFADYHKMLEAYQSASHDDILSFADEISVPTLVINGDRDEIAPIAESRELAQAIPGAQFAEIAGVGHILHHETPAETAQLITDFLAEK
jgi:pimeloyl-ACP methyl ester carboxylesterase